MSFYSQMSWLCRKSKGVCMHTLVHTLELISLGRLQDTRQYTKEVKICTLKTKIIAERGNKKNLKERRIIP